MKLLAATNNKNKLLEFRRILTPLGIEVLSPADAGVDADVEETGETFAENARLKATVMRKLTGLPTIADDSGLCVDALGGRPGVYSARYLGGASQPEKNAAILSEMWNIPEAERTARFVCAICCVLDENTHITCEGVCEGIVAREPSGDGGFGYDPIFLVGEESFASLSGEQKDACSHRGKALRALAEKLGVYYNHRTSKI